MVCDWSMSRNLNILDVCWTNQVDETEFRRKVASGRRVVDAIRYLVNARCSQLECAIALNDTLFVLFSYIW